MFTLRLARNNACVTNGTLRVSGLTAGEQWSVYNVAGTMIYHGISVETQCMRLYRVAAYYRKTGQQFGEGGLLINLILT